jgi:type IV secretion system protein TrbL
MISQTMNAFLAAFMDGTNTLLPAAIKLGGILFSINFTLSLLQDLIADKLMPIAFVCRQILIGGGWYYFIRNYPSICDEWLDGCIWIGTTLSSGSLTIADLRDPSVIIDKGIELAEPIWAMVQSSAQFLNPIGMLVYPLIYLVILLSFWLIALQVAVTMVEFYVVAAISVMMVAFGPWQRSAFLAESGIKAVVGLGLKMAVCAAILGVVYPLLRNTGAQEGVITVKDGAKIMMDYLFLAALCWMVPNMAAGLISGTPALNSNKAIPTPTPPSPPRPPSPPTPPPMGPIGGR